MRRGAGWGRRPRGSGFPGLQRTGVERPAGSGRGARRAGAAGPATGQEGPGCGPPRRGWARAGPPRFAALAPPLSAGSWRGLGRGGWASGGAAPVPAPGWAPRRGSRARCSAAAPPAPSLSASLLGWPGPGGWSLAALRTRRPGRCVPAQLRREDLVVTEKAGAGGRTAAGRAGSRARGSTPGPGTMAEPAPGAPHSSPSGADRLLPGPLVPAGAPARLAGGQPTGSRSRPCAPASASVLSWPPSGAPAALGPGTDFAALGSCAPAAPRSGGTAGKLGQGCAAPERSGETSDSLWVARSLLLVVSFLARNGEFPGCGELPCLFRWRDPVSQSEEMAQLGAGTLWGPPPGLWMLPRFLLSSLWKLIWVLFCLLFPGFVLPPERLAGLDPLQPSHSALGPVCPFQGFSSRV